ncbi:hypothetical protein HIM_00995 [Hirsutella minnesotensis 3608]|nr:hypothetical protein HIM_00995 [Hirsutella minnesotensis 3608]
MLGLRLLRPRCGAAPGLASSIGALAVPAHLQASCTSSPRLVARRLLSSTRRRPLREDRYERLREARPLVRKPRAVMAACVVAAVIFYMCNSQTDPVTGRRRFNFLSEELVQKMYKGASAAVLRAVEREGGRLLPDGDPRVLVVKRIMARLIPVCGMPDVDWEVFVVHDDDPAKANAFMIPGGAVIVYSSLIDICRNEDALAVVLGHEIAHHTASHVAERMSAAWTGNLATGSLFFLAGALPGIVLFGLWAMIGGTYLQGILVNLPMGRKQESEADYLGLMMMAEACYDPRAAIGLWQRLAAFHSGHAQAPEILSTHPSDKNRIAQLSEWMPEALRRRSESDCRGTTALADRFRIALQLGIPIGSVRI